MKLKHLQVLLTVVVTLYAIHLYLFPLISPPAGPESSSSFPSFTTFFFSSPSPSPSASASPSASPSPASSSSPPPIKPEWAHTCLLITTTPLNDSCSDNSTRHDLRLGAGTDCLATTTATDASAGQSPEVNRHVFSEAEQREQFTVVLLSMAQRVAMLERVLHEYDGRPEIAEIIVVMNGLNESHVSSRLGVARTPISFVNNSINSLNARFTIADQVKTAAVLANDDDLYHSRHSAEYLFRVWQMHRRSIVGRTLRTSGDGVYQMNQPCPNIVLTNAAFVPTELMRTYAELTEGPIAQLRALIENCTNCEDIGINFVAAATGMDPPVNVHSGPVEISHSSGLSSRRDHYSSRSLCGHEFTGFFGGLVLPNIAHHYNPPWM